MNFKLENFNIPPLDQSLRLPLQAKLDSRTKPLGSLGRLEDIAMQVGRIQNSLTPHLRQPRITVFAGDHGAVADGISAYPQAVTAQMVCNFLAGGAAINVLAQQAGLALTVIDAGVANDFDTTHHVEGVNFISAKLALGTKNYLTESAMTAVQCSEAIGRGASLVRQWHNSGCNAIGFGEMGIGNTSSASLLTHALCDAPLEEVVGRGTGLDDAGLALKKVLLQRAVRRVAGTTLTPLQILAEFGSFEIAMMTGAYLAAAQARMLIVVDGFIATSALLVAHALYPTVRDYCVFSHCSAEPGHRIQLNHLNAQPLLELGLRLGEGTGSAMAFPIINAALALINEMAGFDSAGVSQAGT